MYILIVLITGHQKTNRTERSLKMTTVTKTKTIAVRKTKTIAVRKENRVYSTGKYIKVNGLEASLGNIKVKTLIFNFGTAAQCPSDSLGLCEYGKKKGTGEFKGKCYALKAEVQYKKDVPAYRKRQAGYWLNTSTEQLLHDFGLVIAQQTGKRIKKKLTKLRFNESGDMYSRKCLDKMIALAKAYPSIQFYTYTHRLDIMGVMDGDNGVSIEELPSNLVINLSYPNAKLSFNTFIAEKDLKTQASLRRKPLDSINPVICPMSCDGCNICPTLSGKTCIVPVH
jgi:hypothetical protein